MWKTKGNSLAILALAISQAAWGAPDLPQLLHDAARGGHYAEPREDHLAQAETLFARTLAGGDETHLKHEWAALGFDLLRVDNGTDRLLVLRENPARKEGRGFYAFRSGSSGRTAWQAPHSNDDERTGRIVLDLFEQGRYVAAAWNTVPRRQENSGVALDSDLAHRPASYFLAFSRAFAGHFNDGSVVQLHGFAPSRRRSGAGASADLILSAGDRAPRPALRAIASCLKAALPYQVRIFPLDIDELGATTNSIGKALRNMGYGGFVHIETSPALREDLSEHVERRAQLIGCLPR